MYRHSMSRSLVRGAVGLLGVAACAATSGGQGTGSRTSVSQSTGSRTSVTLATGASRRFAADAPVSLGQRRIGPGTRRAAMLSVADSVVRAWGWQIASVDLERGAMRTEWLYFAGTEMTPNAGRECEGDAIVGLRLIVEPRNSSKNSSDFVVRGEARVVEGRDRADAQRFAHHSFGTIGAALQEASPAATHRPDVFSTELERLSGEVVLRQGGRADGCVTLRP